MPASPRLVKSWSRKRRKASYSANDAFSLLYDWRVVAVPRANPMNDEQLRDLERQVQFWENSSSVRDRYIALHDPAAEIIMFLEFVPHILSRLCGRWDSLKCFDNDVLNFEGFYFDKSFSGKSIGKQF